ncbi:Uncharacterised protein [uncultured archaeon]|nr:Uncharacterised protein [uncultured archaeon]
MLSFLYAFAAIASILFVYSYYSSLKGDIDSTEHHLLVLEDRHAREMELKRAVTDTIRHSVNMTLSLDPNADPEAIQERIGNDLSLLRGVEGAEGYKNYSYGDFRSRFTVRFWCGNPSKEELDRVAETHDWSKKSDYICEGCHYLDEEFAYITFDSDGNVIGGGTRNLCAQLLSVDKGNKIISVSASQLKNAILRHRIMIADPLSESVLLSGDSMFGVMVYDSAEDVSSVAVIPMSTEIRWIG